MLYITSVVNFFVILSSSRTQSYQPFTAQDIDSGETLRKHNQNLFVLPTTHGAQFKTKNSTRQISMISRHFRYTSFKMRGFAS